MKPFVPPGTPIDLANCDAEPIHVPGSIQPHGALLAFTLDGALASASANAAALLGSLPPAGKPLAEAHLTPEMRACIEQMRRAPGEADSFEVALADGRAADLGLHVHDGLLIAEFEPRAAAARPSADFAAVAQRALDRVQRQADLASLLEASVEEIAKLSGFDRVMAYRFHPDDSGEVVAERMRRPLEPFLGLRYPASDIPAQARALFVANPVRLIVDVAYRPEPLAPDRNPVTGGPIDLSHAVLRSVSPIHCEYLTNMGVRASMSMSIVAQGRLWGLFACHHYEPHLVSPVVRLTCRLLSQVVSLMVERVLAARRAEAMAAGLHLRDLLLQRVKGSESVMRALLAGEPTAADVVRCSGVVVTSVSQQQSVGETPDRDGIARLLEWLAGASSPASFATSHLAADLPELQGALAGFAGLLAIRFSAEPNSYVIWFRREQVETLRWAGNPEKAAMLGRHGERLSPRGSFAEWKEVVRGRSEAWEESEKESSQELRRALSDFSAARLQEVVRARELLLAMLGHDLRSPLQAIANAGEVLRLDESRAQMVQKVIARSSGRMGRLITHVLDLSRLSAGVGLTRDRAPRDLAALLRDVVAEARASHPESEVLERYAEVGSAPVDADRIAQVLGNLLSNARHHGSEGKPVVLEGVREGGQVVLRVTNHGPAITQEALQTLFEPFKRGSLDNSANPRGLGMGLYIASSIVAEHGGSLDVTSGDGLVTFTIRLPAGAA